MAEQISSWRKPFRITSWMCLLLPLSATTTWPSQALAARLVALDCTTTSFKGFNGENVIDRIGKIDRYVIDLDGRTWDGYPAENSATHIRRNGLAIDRTTLKFSWYGLHTQQLADCVVVPTEPPKF